LSEDTSKTIDGTVKMSGAQKWVLCGGIVFFLSWMGLNYERLTGDQEGLIRLVLGLLFAGAILWRRETELVIPASPGLSYRLVGVVVLGAIVEIAGLIFTVRQFQWLGVLSLLFACLRWALPSKSLKTLLLALFVLFWIHPLPSPIFGRIQQSMQWLSVWGSEWFLHIFNVRVWAHEMLLDTGYHAFGVPEACSGMRTVVTVMTSVLGVGILLRLGWLTIGVFMLAGMAQALVLNILRISGMVLLSPFVSPEHAETLLHDSMGIFLLLTIVLVQVEMSLWSRVTTRHTLRENAIHAGRFERPDQATRFPIIWNRTGRLWATVLLLVLMVAGISFAVYKRRHAHRGVMIADVAERLMVTDLAKADEAIQTALWLLPGNRDLLDKRITVLVMRGKFDDALRVFNRLPNRLTDEETALKSWALLVMGQEEEALRLLDTLPEKMRNSPAVAMIRAEHAVRSGHPEEVAHNVMTAVNDMRLVQRVRMFFPYLAMHEQWEAIHKCENGLPYKDLAQALLSVHAHLKMNDASAAANVLTQVLEKWPDSPMCLNSLFAIALRRPGGYWEERFAESFRKNASLLDTDILPYYMNYCFQMQRPELGWLAYRRMQEKDPSDPGLLLASVRFGENWFSMRRRQMKVGSEAVEESIDLRPFYYLTRHMDPFAAFWKEIPLLDELKDKNHVEAVRREYLDQAIHEFERREKEGSLTLRMAMAFPGALAMDKRYPEAHAKLDNLEKKYPDMRQEITLQRATFYDQCGEMERSYELLRSWFADEKISSLTSALLMINAMMNLDMGVCAMDVVSKAEKVFPGAGQVGIATAGILDVFGQKEQALFTLTRFQTDLRYSAGVQLLYDSGRYEEAEQMSRVFGVRLKRNTDQSQILGVLPAEFSIRRRLPPPVSMEEATRAIENFSIAAEKTPNPFFKGFAKKLVEWYRQTDSGNVDEWEAIGRDKYEKVTTLHRLAVLQARQKKYDVAIAAIDRAVDLMPDSPFLRRIQIMLKEGDAATVEAALLACPDDPEIWLASLVMRYQRGHEKDKAWAMEEITRATEGDRFPVGDIVRAGDFFLRMNVKDVAVKAAKYAIPRCRGYLPAYALGVRCGVLTGDLKWALECSLLGIENARDPRPFYVVLTDIKVRSKQLDNDLITGLEYLQNRAPEQKIWSEILGAVYFDKKDTKRAMSVLTPIIYEDMRGVRVQSLLLAAESARVEGEMTKAVDILEMANAMYPERLSVLNNLVYSLAQNDQTLDKARMLLPRLLDMGGDSYAVLDTASTVYMRSGDARRAREYMEKALSKMKKDAYGASEVNLNAARLFFNTGDYEAARRKAEEVRNSPEAGRLVEAHARALLEQIKAIKH